eukprot:gene22579-25030_t
MLAPPVTTPKTFPCSVGVSRSAAACAVFRRAAIVPQAAAASASAAVSVSPAVVTRLDVGWWSVGQHRALSAEASSAHAATEAAAPAPNVPRRPRKANHRFGIPDTQPEIVKKFINCTMKHGKKSIAQRIFNDAMSELKIQELARIRKEAEAAAAKASKSDTAIEHAQQENVDPVAMFVESLNTLMPVIGTLGI